MSTQCAGLQKYGEVNFISHKRPLKKSPSLNSPQKDPKKHWIQKRVRKGGEKNVYHSRVSIEKN